MMDGTAFVYQEYPRLRGYLISCGACDRDAGEIANDASLIVLNRWNRLRADLRYAGQPPRAYLYKVARRLWQRAAKRQTDQSIRLVTHDETAAGDADRACDKSDPADRIDDQMLACRLVGLALGQLKPLDRQVLWLRLALEFSTADTATVLDIPEGTVKSRLSAAKSRFKEAVRQGGWLVDTSWEAIR
jgi:RNA polymerase sigma-70 factor (ECF subfamily)